MQLFKKTRSLAAVCRGRCVPLSEVPDEAFAGGMLGVGFAVEPLDGEICSPADGSVGSIAEAKHAYSIQTEDGLDVLVHIGVDTVRLHGEGFSALVKEGDRVSVGTPLAQVDLELLKNRNIPSVTAVLVTEPEKITDIEYRLGSIDSGNVAMLYRKGRKG